MQNLHSFVNYSMIGVIIFLEIKGEATLLISEGNAKSYMG